VLNRTPAAELDFGSEANHAISNYQTVFAAVPTVKQNQPPLPALWHRTIEDERHRNVPEEHAPRFCFSLLTGNN
jgi:hypothetical protein